MCSPISCLLLVMMSSQRPGHDVAREMSRITVFAPTQPYGMRQYEARIDLGCYLSAVTVSQARPPQSLRPSIRDGDDITLLLSRPGCLATPAKFCSDTMVHRHFGDPPDGLVKGCPLQQSPRRWRTTNDLPDANFGNTHINIHLILVSVNRRV
jgi:hypothetical protein